MTLDGWLQSVVGLLVVLLTSLCEGGRRITLIVFDIELAALDGLVPSVSPSRDWLTSFLARCRSNADPLLVPTAI